MGFSILRAATLIVLASQIVLPLAHAMNVRDIFYLNKYGQGVSGVSWCSDRAFTFLTHGPARNTAFPPDYSRDTTVTMFTIESNTGSSATEDEIDVHAHFEQITTGGRLDFSDGWPLGKGKVGVTKSGIPWDPPARRDRAASPASG